MEARRDTSLKRILITGLIIAAIGLTAAWLASQPRPSFPFGIAILLAAATLVAFTSPRLGSALVALGAAGLVASRLPAADRVDELRFSDSAALGVARWVQAIGLLIAAVSVVVLVLRRLPMRGRRPVTDLDPAAAEAGGSQRSSARHERRARAAQIAGLLALSAIGAELLSAYNDNTGHPGELLFAVVFFAGLYGAPALLMRELARRNGWGWPSIIMLAFAFGILQPAVIDQALFSTDYRDIESWSQSMAGTFIAPLGFSATNALNFVLGHVIYSFCAPIAVAEAWRPRTSRRPWIGLPGTVIAGLAYVATAWMILGDPESHSASAAQIAASLAVAGLCIGAAVLLGRTPRREPSARRAPSIWLTMAGSFVLMVMATAGPESWTGVAITVAAFTAGTVLLGYLSRSDDWSLHHTVAVAIGALLSRAVLAFSYFPVIGDTSPTRKYTHNLAMLGIVGLVGWLALRRRKPEPHHIGEPAEPDPTPATTSPA